MTSPTRFLYPVASDFLDDGPLGFSAASGTGSFVSEGSFPRGAGYDNPDGSNSNRLDLPHGILGNVGNGTWTLEFWCRGFDWDALSVIQNGIFTTRGTGSTNRIIIRTSASGDNFALSLIDSANQGSGGDTSLAAVNGATWFFSLTRNGEKVYFHIGGELRLESTINASDAFDFSDNSNQFLSNLDVTGPTQGRVSDIRFSNAALYGPAATRFQPSR